MDTAADAELEVSPPIELVEFVAVVFLVSNPFDDVPPVTVTTTVVETTELLVLGSELGLCVLVLAV